MKNKVGKHLSRKKGLAIITGCDTGIGRSLVKILMEQGYTVVLSYLEQNPFADSPNVYSKKMDLRISEEVESFCQYVKELCSGGEKLEALIPNAGVALGGPIENLPMSMYRESFEINFFGVVRIVQALIPELVDSRGTIIVNGSIAGKVAMPFLSPYASSKFALEGFCDSLRRELSPFGVKTVLVEPAAVATPIWNKAKLQDISFVDKRYMKSLYSLQDVFIESGNQGMDVDEAASYIADILQKKSPKPRYIVAKNRFISKLKTILPATLIDRIVPKMLEMDYGAKNRG